MDDREEAAAALLDQGDMEGYQRLMGYAEPVADRLADPRVTDAIREARKAPT